MAYGDATHDCPPLAWAEYEEMEWRYRLGDLLDEWYGAFALALHPDSAVAANANAEWRRIDAALEETALEFVVHRARRRMDG